MSTTEASGDGDDRRRKRRTNQSIWYLYERAGGNDAETTRNRIHPEKNVRARTCVCLCVYIVYVCL